MQKALSCANVNDKLANPLKLMAYTVQVSLVEFTCKFVCKMFKHFTGHDIPLISTHIFILMARYLYYIAEYTLKGRVLTFQSAIFPQNFHQG